MKKSNAKWGLCALILVCSGLLYTTGVTASGSKAQDQVSDASVGKWSTDLEAALAVSQKSKKPVLVDFTGSDWCGWCIRLHGEVFAKKEFYEWADKHVELVKLDFPQGKPQSKEEKMRNQMLAQKYGVTGFPTIILMDGDGKLLARTGYRPGGPQKYIQHLAELLKK